MNPNLPIVETGTYAHDGLYDDYAVAWNGSEPVHLNLGWGGNDVRVNASQADQDAYRAYLATEAFFGQLWSTSESNGHDQMLAARKAEQDAYEASVPRVGKMLEVVRGRKVAKGFRAVCAAVGYSQYGQWVAFDQPTGRIFVSASNVAVVA